MHDLIKISGSTTMYTPWLPMNLAPRDGTEILILSSHGIHTMSYIVYDVGNDQNQWVSDVEGIVIDDLTINSTRQLGFDSSIPPSYDDGDAIGWMPLPDNTKQLQEQYVNQNR